MRREERHHEPEPERVRGRGTEPVHSPGRGPAAAARDQRGRHQEAEGRRDMHGEGTAHDHQAQDGRHQGILRGQGRQDQRSLSQDTRHWIPHWPAAQRPEKDDFQDIHRQQTARVFYF